MPKRSAEEVCIEYAIAAEAVRELTRKIVPGECTTMATAQALEFWQPGYKEERTEPCISRLFNLKPDGMNREHYQEASEEIEEEMCDRCKISLEATRQRKVLRLRLGAAKRAVGAVGKRINAGTSK